MSTLQFFVFGAERSGTSLLARLISAHPAAYVLEEAGLYSALADAWRAYNAADLVRHLGQFQGRTLPQRAVRLGGPWHPHLPVLDGLPEADTALGTGLVREFVRQLRTRYRRRAEEGAEGGRFREHLGRLDPRPWLELAQGGRLDVATLLGAAHRALLPQECEGASVLGEKSWVHLFLAPWIGSLHPSAVRITLVRHPLTNVASIRAELEGDLELAIQRYLSFHMARFRRLYDPAHGLVLRYEDLVQDPDRALAQVRARLGLLNFPVLSNTAPSPVDPRRNRRRLTEWTREERRRIEDECAEVIARFYPEG